MLWAVRVVLVSLLQFNEVVMLTSSAELVAPEPYKVVCGAVQYEGGMPSHQVRDISAS